jgi:hypothetical protein
MLTHRNLLANILALRVSEINENDIASRFPLPCLRAHCGLLPFLSWWGTIAYGEF